MNRFRYPDDHDAGGREAGEDIAANRSGNRPIGEVLAMRYGRRDLLKAGLAAAVMAALAPPRFARAAENGEQSAFAFEEIDAGISPDHALAPDHELQVVLSWGDPLFPDAPEFDPRAQSPEAQARQFGYNNDYVAFVPLPGEAGPSGRGLLCVNHEFTSEGLMFPGLGEQYGRANFAGMTRELVDIEMAAHGVSVVEIARDAAGRWSPLRPSRYNRRVTATTPMAISGPAAGHARLRTSADPHGRRVLGTVNNCAGGVTPWGTYLAAEENINYYFWGELAPGHPEARNHARLGLPAKGQAWGKFYDRFDVGKEPNEANRFGWVVELDPFDPQSAPVKRTALGRFKHEGCETILNGDGRVVLYMGDDQRFDYVYRFVTARAFDPARRAANRDLLDDGTLSVARFEPDGTLRWLPLVAGAGPLTPGNGFASQADVLIETRRAADLLGATPMDRPEDVQPNHLRGTVYVVLTNNTKREGAAADAANPRGPNPFGHILELTPPGGDHTADLYRWEPLVLCGPPGPGGATFNERTSPAGWFAAPDNCAVDDQGRLWVATDQGGLAARTGRADGLWALDTRGEWRATGRLLFRAPVGAEVCGPVFTPDAETLFLSVQHPGEGRYRDTSGNQVRSTFDAPSTRWPDFRPDMPPRPSVVAIRRKGGGKVGGVA